MELRICIDVDDMERAVAFYTQGLGLQVGRRFKSDFVELLGAGSPIDLLFNAPGSRPIAGGPGSEVVRDYRRHWTPVHLDFVVEDIEAAVARLQQHGAVLEMPVAERAWGASPGWPTLSATGWTCWNSRAAATTRSCIPTEARMAGKEKRSRFGLLFS